MYLPSGDILKEVFSGFLKKSSMGMVRTFGRLAQAESNKISKK
jgi:hypothetical protein